jgi:flagellar hook assembly protein FlgD
VTVYDVRGRRLRDIARNRYAGGRHVVTWDTRDARGTPVASGVYLVRARIGAFSADRKVLVVG